MTTRAHSRSLDLEEGTHVWITPSSGAATVPAMKPLLETGFLTYDGRAGAQVQ